MSGLTVEELKQALPPALRNNATQEFADRVNQIAEDPDVAREVRNNFLAYKRILTEGAYKTEDYLNAVAYCTFKLMGLSNKDSYINTFPERYQRLTAEGRSSKEIAAYIASYNSNKLVCTILEQAVIPVWLLNRDIYQSAINTQALLMQTADSELVRTQAANSLLLHLKQPEIKKVELDVNLKGGGGLDELKDTMARLAETQAELIANGAGARVVSRIPLKVNQGEQITDVVPVVRQQPQVVPATRPALTDLDKKLLGQRAEMERLGPTFNLTPQAATKFDESLGKRVNQAAEKNPEGIKGPAANYARCCDNDIADCMCVETEHIYLPTKEDVPNLKRVSLFDDPAGMP